MSHRSTKSIKHPVYVNVSQDLKEMCENKSSGYTITKMSSWYYRQCTTNFR